MSLQKSSSKMPKIRLFSKCLLGDTVWRIGYELQNFQLWQLRHYKMTESALFFYFSTLSPIYYRYFGHFLPDDWCTGR